MPTDGSTRLLLRPADVTDGPAVAAVHLAARRQAPMPPAVHSDDEVRAWLAGRLRSDDEVWVAEVGGRVVGYARATGTWLDDLYVDPGAARRGVGAALLDLVKSRRPGGFCLWVFETNTPARDFYARHGLVELERTDGSANEERAPDLRAAWPGVDPAAFFARELAEVEAHLSDLRARRRALVSASAAAR